MMLRKICRICTAITCAAIIPVLIFSSCEQQVDLDTVYTNGGITQNELDAVSTGGNDSADDKMDVRRLVQVTPHERQIAWQNLGFTAFIHYGMNTFINQEWGYGDPIGHFEETPDKYAPSDLNTDQWCETLAAAGAKAVIFTAKHHDGFAMWLTDTTTHSVKSSNPPHNTVDVVKELSKSCTKYGLKMGIYLSAADGNKMQYGGDNAIPYDPENPQAFADTYNEFYKTQIRELLSGAYGNYGEYREDGNYEGRKGEIFSFWIDGAQGHVDAQYQPKYDYSGIYKLIRELQPMCAISNAAPDAAWIGNEAANVLSTMWSVLPAKLADGRYVQDMSQNDPNAPPINKLDPNLGSRDYMKNFANLIWYPFEADVSIRNGWFFHSNESPKSLSNLINMYERTVGGNVNLLLNIPPDTTGQFNKVDVDRLKELGTALGKIYDKNLLDVPGVTIARTLAAAGHPAENILKDDESYWRPNGEREAAQLTINLPALQDITHVMLQEQIRQSQRIERFSIEVQNPDNTWTTVSNGTTIGVKKICRFTKTQAKAIRITIMESRLYPTLRFVAAYLDKN